MKSLLTYNLLAAAILLGSDAFACSCGPRGNVEFSLLQATDVVIADVVSVEQHSATDDASSPYVTETATFRIVETLKGGSRAGDLLPIHSNLGPGPCGMSVKNFPVWLETVKKGKPTPVPLSGRWLIYGQGERPFELNRCSRTKPMELGGEHEARRIRALIKRATTAGARAAQPQVSPKSIN